MLLKTYTRILTTDLEATVATLKAVHETEPHIAFDFDPWKLVGIGNVLVVAGTEESLASIRGSLGPWIVEDIDAVKTLLLKNGTMIVRDIELVPTGKMMYMKHSDGHVVEYVQWKPELAEKFIFEPLRAGTLASQL